MQFADVSSGGYGRARRVLPGDLEEGAGVELQVAEAMAIGEQRFDLEHGLPGACHRLAG
jgi:hypothetical protein